MGRSSVLEKALVEAVEEKSNEKPETLARYVSDALMDGMPRIAPELFERKRIVKNVELDLAQKDRILDSLMERRVYFCQGGEWSFACSGEIPFFFYGLHDEGCVIYKNCLVPEASGTLVENIEKIMQFLDSSSDYKGGSFFSFSREMLRIKKGDLGDFSSTLGIRWKAPYKLDVGATIPDVPEKFVELGDEAIAEYYAVVKTAPAELRRTTQLASPRIGVLWAPADEALYVTGKVPVPKMTPQPRGDPAMILDIPDGGERYRHVVAVWDIGEELPFRNWLAEYSEGRR